MMQNALTERPVLMERELHRGPQYAGAPLVVLTITCLAFVGCSSRSWRDATPDFESYYRTRSVSARFQSTARLEVVSVGSAHQDRDAGAVAAALPGPLVEAVKRAALFTDSDANRNIYTARCRLKDHLHTASIVRIDLECAFIDEGSGNERARAEFRGEVRGTSPTRDGAAEHVSRAFATYLSDYLWR